MRFKVILEILMDYYTIYNKIIKIVQYLALDPDAMLAFWVFQREDLKILESIRTYIMKCCSDV